MNEDSTTVTTPVPVRAGRPARPTVAWRPPRTDLVGEWVEPGPARAGRAVPFGLALLACVARVYLGAHNPLDVVAGAGAGLLLGGLLTLVVGVPAAGPPGRRDRGSAARAADAGAAEG
jgi:hypothetical protein